MLDDAFAGLGNAFTGSTDTANTELRPPLTEQRVEKTDRSRDQNSVGPIGKSHGWLLPRLKRQLKRQKEQKEQKKTDRSRKECRHSRGAVHLMPSLEEKGTTRERETKT